MSSSSSSRRPYLIRAIYDWSLDNGYTPHLLVAADAAGVVVPREYVQDGKIALNISPMAVQGFDAIQEPLFFSARFGGRPFEMQVPVGAVLAIYARENGEGMVFSEVEAQPTDPNDPASPEAPRGGQTGDNPPSRQRPKLRVIK